MEKSSRCELPEAVRLGKTHHAAGSLGAYRVPPAALFSDELDAKASAANIAGISDREDRLLTVNAHAARRYRNEGYAAVLFVYIADAHTGALCCETLDKIVDDAGGWRHLGGHKSGYFALDVARVADAVRRAASPRRSCSVKSALGLSKGAPHAK